MAKNTKPQNASESPENGFGIEAGNSTPEGFEAESDAKTEATVASGEARYTVDEFAAASKTVFGEEYNADLVRAAFFLNRIKEATTTEAKKIVTEYANKEVKSE